MTLQSQPKLHGLVQAATLLSIETTLVVYRQGNRVGPDAGPHGQAFHTRTTQEESGFRVLLHLVACDASDNDGKPLAIESEDDYRHHAHVHIEAVYSLPEGYEIDMEEVRLYGSSSGVLHTYPFARELVANLSGRSGSPLLINPSPVARRGTN